MEKESSRRRGRPASPTGSPLGEYLRRRREALGLTVRDLARAVGMPSTSASYFSQLEAGVKAPNLELAQRLTETLGDDVGVFVLWSQTARRSEPSRAARARRVLARLLDAPELAHDPHFTPPAQARIEAARESLMRRQISSEPPRDLETWEMERRRRGPAPAERPAPRGSEPREQSPPDEPGAAVSMRSVQRPAADRTQWRSPGTSRPVSVPILPEGDDPDDWLPRDAGASSRWDGEHVRLDAEAAETLRLERPFAYRLGSRGARRASAMLQPGDLVVVSRERGPLVPHEVYAVRCEGRVELGQVLWNGRELLLLPDVGENDFVVFPAWTPAHLERLVVGHIATVVRGTAGGEHQAG